jgi:hypothetical protein
MASLEPSRASARQGFNGLDLDFTGVVGRRAARGGAVSLLRLDQEGRLYTPARAPPARKAAPVCERGATIHRPHRGRLRIELTVGRGTEGSNPAPSSGESGANRNWPAGTSRSSAEAGPGAILHRGTEGSNPPPSSGESGTNRLLR